MGKRDGQQPGAQQHAEGQHGERTHARFLEQIQHPMNRDEDEPVHRDGDLAAAAGINRPNMEAAQDPDEHENGGRDGKRR